MEQLTTLPRLGDPGAMEPWALPAWQHWTQGQGCKPGDASASIAATPTALQVKGLRSEESSEPAGAHSPGPIRNTDPEGTETVLPKLGQQAESPGYSCSRLEGEDAQAYKVREVEEGCKVGQSVIACNPTAFISCLGMSLSVSLSLCLSVLPSLDGNLSGLFRFSLALPLSVCASVSL